MQLLQTGKVSDQTIGWLKALHAVVRRTGEGTSQRQMSVRIKRHHYSYLKNYLAVALQPQTTPEPNAKLQPRVMM